jgi:glycosyltransferase involved in cell wall biosynthesis
MVVHHTYPLAEPRVEREAQAVRRHGYEVDVICLRERDEPAVDVAEGVNVYRLPVRRVKGRGAAAQMVEYLAFFVLAFFKLTQLHARRRYGVVQLHNLPDFLVFAALWPKLTGARVILDIHDVMPEFYAVRFKRSMNSWLVRPVLWEEKLSCRFADHVITVTDRWRQELIRRGVPAEKVTVVMNLADERIFTPPAAAESRLRDPNTFKLIYHGSITKRYGLDLAVQAVERVRHQIPGIHLTIVGKGEYRQVLMQLAEDLKLQDHVQFVDTTPIAALPQLIRQADIGITPYRRDIFTDGCLPTKLMEYMALGMTAIAARTPVITDYFDDTLVEFFTPEDVDDLVEHIEALHTNSTRLNELAANTAKFNQRYNWASQAARYTELVDSLAQKIDGKKTRT